MESILMLKTLERENRLFSFMDGRSTIKCLSTNLRNYPSMAIDALVSICGVLETLINRGTV